MGKQTPGKYRRRGSYQRKAVKSQRIRRAREKNENFERQNLECRGNDKVTVSSMFDSLSIRAILERTGKLTVSRIFNKPSAKAIIGKELTICNISTNSSITVPLRRIGRRTIDKVANKLPANALLGTDRSMSHISNIPSLSAPAGRSRITKVGRVLKKTFVNPLLGEELMNNRVFHNPLRCEVTSRKGDMIVYDHSATLMLSKNLTVPKVSEYTSLSALLCRRGSKIVACVISKPSNATTLNARESTSAIQSPGRSENVTDSSLLNEPSLCLPLENVTDSVVVNGPPTTASFENVTAFNACNKPSPSVPLLKREIVTDEDDSNKLSTSASLERCENVTDASVTNKHSSGAPLENVTDDTHNKPSPKDPTVNSQNGTLLNVSGCSSPALPLDETSDVTVAGVSSLELPTSENNLPQNTKSGTLDSRPKENEGSIKLPKITSDKKINKELAAKHKTSESENGPIDLNLISPPKTTICTDTTAGEWLDIEQYHVVSENKFPGGRFICDLRSVIRQAREIEAHSARCHFGGKLTYYRTTREGLVHTFYYSCSSPNCGASIKLVTDGDSQSLNRLAVSGAVSNGSGFPQEEKKFRAMNVKYMNRNKFSEYDPSPGKSNQSANKSTMTDESPSASPSPSRSENVTDSSLLNEPSLCVPFENVTDSFVVNGSPTTASFENVTAFNACNKPYLSVPLLKREVVTEGEDSDKLSTSALLERCENVTDASVTNKTADSQMLALLQPKIEMDFCVDENWLG